MDSAEMLARPITLNGAVMPARSMNQEGDEMLTRETALKAYSISQS